MKENKFQMTKLWYAFIHISLWCGYSIVICYCSNFLKAMGYHDGHVSIVLGLASGLAILVQLGMAELINAISFLETYKMIIIQGLIILAATILMLQNKTSSKMAVVGICIGCIALQAIPSLVNSLATENEQRGVGVSFSIARGLGSLAYSVGSFMTGQLIGVEGIRVIPYLAIIIAVLMIFSTIFFQINARKKYSMQYKYDQKDKDIKNTEQSVSKWSFKKYPFLLLFLAGSFCLYINQNLVSTFMQQIMEAKGAGAAQQGTAIAIAGVLELPAMFGFAWLLKKASCAKWLHVSCWCFLIKAIMVLLAPNYIWIYIAQIFQMGGFAVFTVASVEYIGTSIKAEDAVRGQTYLASSTAAGSFIGVSFGGFVCQYIGVSAMIGIAIVLCIAGLLFISKATALQEDKNSI